LLAVRANNSASKLAGYTVKTIAIRATFE
jgi:hypothetical protein